ncbi:hypothetical protein ZIOFF_032095 [Zingiber officinale]|uniref:BED-type domain-containing protein n=1 Tax=Zingiber officinale TaxID=94328 RepID=A0A8J5LBC7_ZINOF|nr:hypothetical protein ZIOFF_032095 [Zingiber officinale]
MILFYFSNIIIDNMNSQPINLDQEENSEEEEPEGALAVSTTTRDLNVDEEMSSQGKASGSGKRKRVLKSKRWQYFEMLPKIEGEDLRCKCKACGITYKAESSMGTGNLRRHILNQCPKQKTSDIAQSLLEQGDKSLAIRSQRFNQERFRELLILAIVKHDLSFQFVEYEAIRSIFTYLEPQVNYFTRNTARTDILKMHKNECNRIAQEMHSCPGKICFTSDLWTSIAIDGYICLTAHFIDSNWILQKRIINFSYMPPPHSSIALCDKINNLFNVWGIQRKVFTITLDIAAANDVFVGLLRDQLVQLTISQALQSSNDFMRSMANRMFHKFDKYWKDYNILFVIVVIVDPRFKMQFVEFCYNKLYGHGSNELSLVRSKLVSLFEEYMHMGIASKVSTSSASSSSHNAIDDNASLALNLGSGCMDVLKEFDTFQSLEFIGRAQKSQLELYLEEPTIDRITKLDVLGFWKAHQFSAMKHDVVEALVCCRDWLAGGKGLTRFMWNPLSWVMEMAAIMAIALANDSGNPPDWQDFVSIVVLLVINSTISFIEENNAGNVVAVLQILWMAWLQKRMLRVVRLYLFCPFLKECVLKDVRMVTSWTLGICETLSRALILSFCVPFAPSQSIESTSLGCLAV